MTDPLQQRTIMAACLACDTEQEIRYRIDLPQQRFACVKCNRKSVLSPSMGVLSKESREPKKPWALSETDKKQLRLLRIVPE